MAEDLTLQIVDQFDDVRYTDLNKTKRVVVTRYKLGRFGPYEHTADQGDAADRELDAAIDARRRALETRTR